jgi:hypothetical protein
MKRKPLRPQSRMTTVPRLGSDVTLVFLVNSRSSMVDRRRLFDSLGIGKAGHSEGTVCGSSFIPRKPVHSPANPAIRPKRLRTRVSVLRWPSTAFSVSATVAKTIPSTAVRLSPAFPPGFLRLGSVSFPCQTFPCRLPRRKPKSGKGMSGKGIRSGGPIRLRIAAVLTNAEPSG